MKKRLLSKTFRLKSFFLWITQIYDPTTHLTQWVRREDQSPILTVMQASCSSSLNRNLKSVKHKYHFHFYSTVPSQAPLNSFPLSLKLFCRVKWDHSNNSFINFVIIAPLFYRDFKYIAYIILAFKLLEVKTTGRNKRQTSNEKETLHNTNMCVNIFKTCFNRHLFCARNHVSHSIITSDCLGSHLYWRANNNFIIVDTRRFS